MSVILGDLETVWVDIWNLVRRRRCQPNKSGLPKKRHPPPAADSVRQHYDYVLLFKTKKKTNGGIQNFLSCDRRTFPTTNKMHCCRAPGCDKQAHGRHVYICAVVGPFGPTAGEVADIIHLSDPGVRQTRLAYRACRCRTFGSDKGKTCKYHALSDFWVRQTR